jgi:tetratricopeptide (TPR) repeat protein
VNTRKQYEEAIICYDDALRKNPNIAVACHNKAKALITLGRYEEADEFIDRAIKLNPNLAVAWSNRQRLK